MIVYGSFASTRRLSSSSEISLMRLRTPASRSVYVVGMPPECGECPGVRQDERASVFV